MKNVGLCFGTIALLWTHMVCAAPAQDCQATKTLAALVRSTSTLPAIPEQPSLPTEYRAQLIIAAHLYERMPTDKDRATALLNLIPKSEAQFGIWITLGDPVCDEESDKDMMTLGHLSDRLPRLVASAAIAQPTRLSELVKFAMVAQRDPHSDYAVQLERVCKLRKLDFLSAVKSMSSDERKEFVARVFNPKRCQALALPEAQEK